MLPRVPSSKSTRCLLGIVAVAVVLLLVAGLITMSTSSDSTSSTAPVREKRYRVKSTICALTSIASTWSGTSPTIKVPTSAVTAHRPCPLAAAVGSSVHTAFATPSIEVRTPSSASKTASGTSAGLVRRCASCHRRAVRRLRQAPVQPFHPAAARLGSRATARLLRLKVPRQHRQHQDRQGVQPSLQKSNKSQGDICTRARRWTRTQRRAGV